RQVRVKSADGEEGQVATAIDQRMIEDMSDRVKRLLMQTSPEIVSAAEALSEHVTYVPVSALGWNNAAIDFETTDGGLVGQ
ncbi:MAG: hypothetical protein QGH11_14505, partial [Pirellulaceae bacterium]|nr:hypothetical protein [Pirellulaceae bacterium]